MAKPIKKNGKWGAMSEDVTTPDGYAGNDGWIATGTTTTIPGSFQEFDADTNASLELASSRYGVPDLAPASTSENLRSALNGDWLNGDGNRLKAAADESNAKWGAQAKTNEGLRSSALSMESTYAQSAAMTRALEESSTVAAGRLATPEVSLKKKGMPQSVSSSFRI